MSSVYNVTTGLAALVLLKLPLLMYQLLTGSHAAVVGLFQPGNDTKR